MLTRVLLSLLFVTSLAGGETFDKPVRKQRVELEKAANPLSDRRRITCYYFPHFMVKEVDLGEVGAERLGILPVTPQSPGKCTRARGKGEMVISSDEWSGYFKGVKGNFVFFDADDGTNGGMGFAVYDARTGKKIFSDVALGALSFLDRPGHELVVKYERLVEAECVIHRGPSGCWRQIRKDLGLESAEAPDCKAGYEKSAETLARGRCQAQHSNKSECIEKEIALARKQTQDSPSVIAYPAELVLGAKPAVRPAGGEVRCWAAD